MYYWYELAHSTLSNRASLYDHGRYETVYRLIGAIQLCDHGYVWTTVLAGPQPAV